MVWVVGPEDGIDFDVWVVVVEDETDFEVCVVVVVDVDIGVVVRSVEDIVVAEEVVRVVVSFGSDPIGFVVVWVVSDCELEDTVCVVVWVVCVGDVVHSAVVNVVVSAVAVVEAVVSVVVVRGLVAVVLRVTVVLRDVVVFRDTVVRAVVFETAGNVAISPAAEDCAVRAAEPFDVSVVSAVTSVLLSDESVKPVYSPEKSLVVVTSLTVVVSAMIPLSSES